MSSILFAAPAPSSGSYSAIKKIPIAGSGSWDYLTVDEAARRLHVSHGTQVGVLDIDSLTLVGAIPKTPGVHEVALAPELGRGFVSNGPASTVTLFALKTLTDCRCADWAKARRDQLRSGDLASLRLQRRKRRCNRD